ncbi:MAG: TIGR00299 family protein [Thaumarchaeota archaeon]|nr:TIGR00299 family protein [Nitrososphaerota archaeon]
MLALVDCQISGISGDMLLSSLIDIGANKKRVIDAVMSCQNFFEGSKITHISFDDVTRSGFHTTTLNIQYDDNVHEKKGVEVYNAISRCCDSLELENKSKAFALASIKTLIEAESNVHGEEFNNVHLHEASSIDTLVDIVGTAVALQDLGLFNVKIYSSRVAVGGGTLTFSHGTITNPGNAILEIFKNRNFTLIGGPVDSELTTPTGASMLVNLANGSIDFYPPLQPIKIGYGAGSKEFVNFPGLLKVVLGKDVQTLQMDTVYVLETNIDDVTGEIIGSIIVSLMEKGANDVNVIPTTKNNRPSNLIRVICNYELLNLILNVLIQKSDTLGVRIQQTSHYTVPRITISIPVSIKGEEFVICVKVVKEKDIIVNAKPEYQDVKNVSMKLNMPFHIALSTIQQIIMNKLSVKQS